jgi:hypothetical protein
MKDLPMHLKDAKISMADGVDVKSTKQLDGEAKDSPVFNEDNQTIQYKTADLPTSDLGGRNDQNG